MFRNAIPKEKRRNSLICPWTKPRGEDLPAYKLRENKEISEQRGSFERHIGRIVNRFSILSKRFRHDTKYIRDMILFIMSLHNLKEHPYLVLSPLINDHEEATSFITDNIDFLMKKLWRYKDPDSNNEQGKKEKLIQRVEIMDVFDDLLLIIYSSFLMDISDPFSRDPTFNETTIQQDLF